MDFNRREQQRGGGLKKQRSYLGKKEIQMKFTRNNRRVIALVMAFVMALAMLPFGAMLAGAQEHNGDVSSADPKNLAILVHEAALVQVKLFSKQRYTSSSYANLQTRFNQASYLLHEERSYVTGEPATQEDIDNMIANLQAALNGMELLTDSTESLSLLHKRFITALESFDNVLSLYYYVAAVAITRWTIMYRIGNDGKYYVSPFDD
ncbi:MAG: hypothetical protein LBT21_03955 [Oscillospiraceae bacterium]|nr:hypothetical protein [Oscillospiraceae bacterium]